MTINPTEQNNSAIGYVKAVEPLKTPNGKDFSRVILTTYNSFTGSDGVPQTEAIQVALDYFGKQNIAHIKPGALVKATYRVQSRKAKESDGWFSNLTCFRITVLNEKPGAEPEETEKEARESAKAE